MCGLVGFVITDEKVSFNIKDRYVRYFTKALYIDTLRGSDSTGVARVDDDWVCETYKKALPGYDYLEHGKAVEFMNDGVTYLTSLMGHNRAATQGAVNATNAHPFTHGSVTLMHNGTLDSGHGVGHKFDVDSENICFTISKCKTDDEVKKVLEDLDGAYALVWYDDKSRTVNMARNDRRPLCYQRTAEGYVYASEGWMIKGGLSEQFQQELVTKGDIKMLPVGEWTRINLESGEVTTVPFVPDEGYSYQQWGKYTTSGNVSSSTKLEEIEGLKKDDQVLVQYTSHSVVNNQNTGKKSVTVYGKLVTQAAFEVPDTTISMSGYTTSDLENILGGDRVFTAKYGGVYSGTKKLQVWVRDHSPTYTLDDLKNNGIIEGDDAIFDRLVAVEEEGEQQWFDMNGTQVSREEMLQYASDKCGWCNDTLDIDAEKLAWAGDYLMHDKCAGEYFKSYEEE
jgi:predicted glutamine amidotransferase